MANWANRVEELVDDGDTSGAIKLLEDLVGELQICDGGGSQLDQLTLAAAMRDLASLYDQQGLFMKADTLRSSAISIKAKAECMPAPTDGRRNEKEPVEPRNAEVAPADDEVEDWEQMEEVPPVNMNKPYLEDNQPAPSPQASNQRGRGAFTFGTGGLYSDARRGVEVFSGHGDKTTIVEDSDKAALCCGARHVLVIDNFSPSTTTFDLEEVVKLYADRGVVIRWINDTTALAVFRNPTIAREALASIRHPPYMLHTLEASTEVHGSVSERDLEPPAPRPPTSARAAQRMIVGALQQQGAIRHNVRGKARFTSEELQKQENDRKQRLMVREKLREEAWGD